MSAIDDRVLALAGLAQALRQVRRIADTGQADAQVVATALDSVFRIDAPSPIAVYGDAAALRPGLRIVRDYLANQADDPLLPRLALAVTQLERRFSGDDVRSSSLSPLKRRLQARTTAQLLPLRG